MALENLTGEWASLLLGSLADAGVTNVVLSPGSRSTPFVIAAELEPRLHCHDAIDERAGAFFALGQARVTGRPTVVICTSGTAGAHYFPAVIEASHARLPLIVITADRPLELQDTSAAQTTDQVKLYGDNVRRFYELGAPDAAPTALAGLRRFAAQAVHASRWPVPGPVHLNARARKPLEPAPAATEEGHALAAEVATLRARPIVMASPPTMSADPIAVLRVARALTDAERGLILCGPGPVQHAGLDSSVADLARRTGFAVLAESASQLRFGWRSDDVVVVDAFDALMRSPRFQDAFSVDVVLQIGGPPVSGGWEQWALAHPEVTRIVLAASGWNDPESQASQIVLGDPGTTIEQLITAITPGRARALIAPAAAWLTAANAAAWGAVTDELSRHAGALTEGGVARTAVEVAPVGSTLMVGNSLPIRLVDTFCPSTGKDIAALSQRGVNGIDGLIAGASGSASLSATPITLLIGDIAFLHDVGGLALARESAVPLVVVVINNRGGRIFEQLPLATSSSGTSEVMRHVVTPHNADLEHAARLYGHAFVRATSVAELEKHLEAAYEGTGCTVVEAVVPEHGAIDSHGRIWAAVDAAMADV